MYAFILKIKLPITAAGYKVDFYCPSKTAAATCLVSAKRFESAPSLQPLHDAHSSNRHSAELAAKRRLGAELVLRAALRLLRQCFSLFRRTTNVRLLVSIACCLHHHSQPELKQESCALLLRWCLFGNCFMYKHILCLYVTSLSLSLSLSRARA